MSDSSRSWRRAVPFLVLAGTVAAFFREPLFTDQTFYFRDIATFAYPTRRLISDLIRDGHLPLWNPYLMSGVPLAANVETNPLYPLSGIYYLLRFDRGFTWFVIGHYAIAGAAMYLLGREWRLSRGAALFGGIAFAFSGPLISLTNVVNFLPGMAWLPLSILGFHRAILHHSWRAAGYTSGVLALQALSDPQTVYFTVTAMALYGVMMLRPPWVTASLTAAGALGGIGMLAALLAAVQLLPLAELYRESARAAGVPPQEATIWTLRLHRLVELLLPRLFGDPAGRTYWLGLLHGEKTPWLLSPYVGITTLILALFGVMVRWRQRVVWFLVVLLGISGALALGDATPVHRLAFAVLPLYRAFRFPEKWWLLAAFAVAGLAGLGVAALADVPGARRRQLALAGLCVVLGGGILLGAFLLQRRPDLLGEPLAPLFRPEDLTMMVAFVTHRARMQGTLTAALLLASALCLVLVGKAGIPGRAMEAGFLLLLIADLTLNGRPLVPVAPARLHETPSPIARVLSEDPSRFRVVAITQDWEHPALVPNLPHAVAYHRWWIQGLYPNTGLRYRLYDQGGTTSAQLKDYRVLRDRFDRAGRTPDNLALWNVRYVLSLRDLTSPLVEPVPVPGLSPPVRVYRLSHGLPRAWIVPTARRFVDREAMLAYMTGRVFDPRREVLLEGEGGPVDATPPGAWRAEIVRHNPNEVTLDVSSDGGGYLVLAETFYPGWWVTVDGGSRPILRANYAMRAVRLEPGAHRVRFVFRPVSVAIGAAISLATLTGLLVLSARRRRSGPKSQGRSRAPG